MRYNEIKNEIDELEKWENKIKQKDLKYATNKEYTYDFQKFETIRSFCYSIYTGKISSRWSRDGSNQSITKYKI